MRVFEAGLVTELVVRGENSGMIDAVEVNRWASVHPLGQTRDRVRSYWIRSPGVWSAAS